MSNGRRYAVWCPGAALVVLALLLVTAPSFVTPLFDSAVDIAGMPAGLVVMVAFWLTIGLVGLVAIRLAHQAETQFGIAVAVVVVGTILTFLAPAVVLVLKNVGV